MSNNERGIFNKNLGNGDSDHLNRLALIRIDIKLRKL